MTHLRERSYSMEVTKVEGRQGRELISSVYFDLQ